MNDHDTNSATVKVLIAWLGTMFGNITLSNAVLAATLIYTALQIYVLLHRIWKGLK